MNFRDNVDYSPILGRDVIFLDMNIWIELADEKTQFAKTIKELLQFLVRDRKLFCPLYWSVLSELYKQEYSSRLRVAKIMDELSLNFSFSPSKEIWHEEVRLFIQSLLDERIHKISRELLFIPFVGYLSSKGKLTYPEYVDETEAMKMSEVIMNNFDKVTLYNLMLIADKVKKDPEADSIYLNKRYKEVWANNKGNKNRIRIENQNFIANIKILPRIKEINRILKPEQVLKITKYISSFPKDKNQSVFNSVIDFMPSLRNEVEILSIVPLDNQRNFTINDFYDIENLLIPLAYSDVFVSQDKWIRHLLKVTDLPQKNNCLYLYNLEDLVQYLNKKYLLN